MQERQLQEQHDSDLEDVPEPEEKASDPEEEIRGEARLDKGRAVDPHPPVASENFASRTRSSCSCPRSEV